jgi:hypothetical protein
MTFTSGARMRFDTEDTTLLLGGAHREVVDLTLTDAVDHPSHYHASTGIEVIDAIEAWELNFALGNVVKYVARAGRKDSSSRAQCLSKALWYLTREIEQAKEEEGTSE